MPKFKKKPVVIEAMQFNGNNGHSLRMWSEGKVIVSPVLEPTPDNPTGEYVQIKTLEGTMTGIVGDWIIRGVKGEYYPCKPDIFGATYEPVEVSDAEKGEVLMMSTISSIVVAIETLIHYNGHERFRSAAYIETESGTFPVYGEWGDEDDAEEQAETLRLLGLLIPPEAPDV